MKETVKTKASKSEGKVEISSKNAYMPDLGELMEIDHAGEVCICEVLKITKELQFSLDAGKRTDRVINTAEVGILASDGIELKTVPVLELKKIDHISELTVSELIEGWVRKNKGIVHQQERSTTPKQKETPVKNSEEAPLTKIINKSDVGFKPEDRNISVKEFNDIADGKYTQLKYIMFQETAYSDLCELLITLIMACGKWHSFVDSNGEHKTIIKYHECIFGVEDLEDFDISKRSEFEKFKNLDFPITLDVSEVPIFEDLNKENRDECVGNLHSLTDTFKLFGYCFSACADTLVLVDESLYPNK